jgi:ATP-dependent protease HslVU (ClpYQ) peptidase subunit
VRVTTVAYKDGVMAADSQCTSGASSDDTTKIFRLKSGGLFGFAGSAGYGMLVYEWLCLGAKLKHKPKILDDDDGIEAIVVSPSGEVSMMDNYLAPISVTSGVTAIGSGGDQAKALMRSGMSAGEAVEFIVANRLDIFTGGEVQVLALKRKAGKSKSCS